MSNREHIDSAKINFLFKKYEDILKSTTGKEPSLQQLEEVRELLDTEDGERILHHLILIEAAAQSTNSVIDEIETDGFYVSLLFDPNRQQERAIVHDANISPDMNLAEPERVELKLQTQPDDRRAQNQLRANEAVDFFYRRRDKLATLIQEYLRLKFPHYQIQSNQNNETFLQPAEYFSFLENLEEKSEMIERWNTYFEGQFPNDDESILDYVLAIRKAFSLISRLQPKWAKNLGLQTRPEPWRSLEAIEHLHKTEITTELIRKYFLNQEIHYFTVESVTWMLFLYSRIYNCTFIDPETFSKLANDVLLQNYNANIKDVILDFFARSEEQKREKKPIPLSQHPSRPLNTSAEHQQNYIDHHQVLIDWAVEYLKENFSKYNLTNWEQEISEEDITEFITQAIENAETFVALAIEKAKTNLEIENTEYSTKHLIFFFIVVNYLQRGASFDGLKGKVFSRFCEDLWKQVQTL